MFFRGAAKNPGPACREAGRAGRYGRRPTYQPGNHAADPRSLRPCSRGRQGNSPRSDGGVQVDHRLGQENGRALHGGAGRRHRPEEVAAPRQARQEGQNPQEVPQPHQAGRVRRSGRGRRWELMTAKCVGCGLDWNVSIYQKIPRTGYICPHCESRIRAGEPLKNIQASPKGRPPRTKGAKP